MKAWGRLLRLSLAPSALADVAAGAVFAQGGVDPRRVALWLLLGASACIYHGGMALNDWADRVEDARVRPDRPIPSGAVRADAALVLALVLLALGPALAWRADPRCGWTMSVVAAAAVLYDVAGRGAWLGPTLLGLCRAGNLYAGILLGALVEHAETGSAPAGAQALHEIAPSLAPLGLALAPCVYGAYVFCVSRVGRLEDSDEVAGDAPRTWTLLALVALAAAPWIPRLVEHPEIVAQDLGAPGTVAVVAARALATVLVLGASVAPARLALTTRTWTRPLLLRTMGMMLRRLLVFTAALALASATREGVCTAAAILAGYPLSFVLRKVFPPS